MKHTDWSFSLTEHTDWPFSNMEHTDWSFSKTEHTDWPFSNSSHSGWPFSNTQQIADLAAILDIEAGISATLDWTKTLAFQQY
jgi:hypothetical protein